MVADTFCDSIRGMQTTLIEMALLDQSDSIDTGLFF